MAFKNRAGLVVLTDLLSHDKGQFGTRRWQPNPIGPDIGGISVIPVRKPRFRSILLDDPVW